MRYVVLILGILAVPLGLLILFSNPGNQPGNSHVWDGILILIIGLLFFSTYYQLLRKKNGAKAGKQ